MPQSVYINRVFTFIICFAKRPGNTAQIFYQIKVTPAPFLTIETQELDESIGKLKEKIANLSKIKLTREQFLNLLKLAPNKMRAGSVVEKDRVARILFEPTH